jgi:hypothetical protein
VTPQGTVLDSAGIAILQAVNDQCSPAVGFDSADFLVVWEDFRSGGYSDIYGARVTPMGAVFDGGSVVSQQGDQSCPRVCCGSGSQMLLVYQGWAGTVGSKTYNIDRMWGKMNPSPAVAEITRPKVRMTNGGATIVRGVLMLGAAGSRQNTGYRAELVNIAGRKVLDLRPGANDVRALAPGVYFVREPQAQAQAPAVRKVIVTR